MIAWWAWPFIALGVAAFALLVIVLFAIVYDMSIERFHDIGYSFNAKRHNKKALKLRLAKDSWQGLPLPTGKQGKLTISRETLVQFPYSTRQIEKIMLDRAIDLGVDISIEWMPYTQRFEIAWHKHKKKRRLSDAK